MTISYRDGIAIGEIIVYLPALAIAIFLSIRHGFGRSSGWIFLVLFTVIRIIGACFQLATISNPTDASLYIGASILQNIGISPLELTALGLLSRVISSINRSQPTFIQPNMLRLIQIMVMVGLILGIVGGTDASDQFSKTGKYVPQTLSKAGLGLFLASFVGLTIATILTSFSISYAEQGEKRLLFAVAAALPFILVRLIYSCIATFANSASFNTITGNATILLCMALLMELCAVIIFEVVGLTLRKVPREERRPAAMGSYVGPGEQKYAPGRGQAPGQAQGPGRGQQVASFLGRRTIIGRIITSAMNSNNNETDVEMQQQRMSRRELRRAGRR